MAKIRQLVQGYKAADMEQSDWSFDLRTEAAMHYYHSPYPEVRSVTSPFDDPDTPCETPRAYFLGLCFMAGATGLNTFFSPRQPAIGIGANVLQLLLAPCGLAAAKILPAWGFKAFGRNFNLNPGPWTYKEQMLSTIIFTIANGAGSTYYVYLVQKLPQYLGQTWGEYSQFHFATPSLTPNSLVRLRDHAGLVRPDFRCKSPPSFSPHAHPV